MTGEISLTCDAWQADNTDGYFAVTGHWIEEHAPGEWTLENALLGFAQMNCSHSGVHLGQMLFKVISRLDIVHKVRTLPFYYYRLAHLFLTQVGHVTCDNAKNNTTMLQEFAECYKLKTGETFDVKRRQIRCVCQFLLVL